MDEPSVEHVACNICGSSASRVRFQARTTWPADTVGHYAATTDRFGAYGTIRQCRDCGLVYTSPRVAAARILEQYAADQDEEYMAECDSRSINAYLSLAVVRRHHPGGRLLDVGCAAGFFLNAARHFYDVSGVEPSEWARVQARDRLKLEIAAPTLEEARFPDGHFDVVTLIDVIEHVPDPAGTLREVNRITRPGGIVYLVTPDIDSLSARVLRGRWWGLRPAHIYYFSRRTMAKLLNFSGYDAIWVGSYGRIFTWRYWLSRLANYPPVLYRLIEAFIRVLNIGDKFLYIDTRDSMQVLARKRA